MSEINYLEVCIEITPFSEENAEIVTAMIEEAGFDSFVTEQPCLKAYIKRELFSQQHLRCLLNFFDNNPDIKLSVTVNPVKQENWNKIWESEFRPICIEGLCTIKASFHKNLLKTDYSITIDPKMAFGTGHHQTTSLMVKWLLKLARLRASMTGASSPTLKGMQVLDMGTGTGVLAILAAKLGAQRPVHAIDVDIVAVNSAKENIYKNRLHNSVMVLHGDSSLVQRSKYDLILANINRNILLADMQTYALGLKSKGETLFQNRSKRGYKNIPREFSGGGLLVISGFYGEDVPLLKKRAEECGLRFAGKMSRDNWTALLFNRI